MVQAAAGQVFRAQLQLHLVYWRKGFYNGTTIITQNDRLYVPSTTKKGYADAQCLLRAHPTFSRSVMVSMAVSKLGPTDLFFAESQWCILPGYPADAEDVASNQTHVGSFCRPAGQHRSTLCTGHCAQDTVALLCCETEFNGPNLWPANSPNPINYRIWGLIQDRIYLSPIQDIEILKRLFSVWDELLSTRQLISGDEGWGLLFVLREST